MSIELVDYESDKDEERDFYVSVIDGERYRLLVGPFDTHDEAEQYVGPATRAAAEADPKAWFYAFGTCSLPKGEAPPNAPLFSRADLSEYA